MCKSLFRSVPDKVHISDTKVLKSSDFVVINSTLPTITVPTTFREHQLFSGLDPALRVHEKVILASAIESHLPFEDCEVGVFCLALPSTSFVNRVGKYILRYAMRGKLPSSILENKEKLGLAGPEDDWLNDPIVRSEITDMVNDRSFIECPLVEGEKFRDAWMKSSGRTLSWGDSDAIWKVLNLFVWDRMIRSCIKT